MKKLFVGYVFFLVFVFALNPAAAQNPYVGFDWDQDGIIDTTGAMDLTYCTGGQWAVDVYLTNWNASHAGDDLYGVTAVINWDPVYLRLISMHESGGPWDWSIPVDPCYPDSGQCTIDVRSVNCVPYAGNQILFYTLYFQCTGASIPGTLITSSTTQPDGVIISGGPSCGSYQQLNGDPGQIEIFLIGPPCIQNISPQQTQVNPPSLGPTFFVNSQGSCAEPAITYYDTCVFADVDLSTGELTTYETLVPESCTVTATDSANPEACSNPESGCTADVYIGGSGIDDDWDGTGNAEDNCPYKPNGPNNGICTAGENTGDNCTDNATCGTGGFCSMNQEDSDNDTLGDVCDNCPYHANPNQTDTDNDTIGDACDICPFYPENDADGDGICGQIDNCPYTPNGQNLGTCVKESGLIYAASSALLEPCMDNSTCGIGEICQMEQGDWNNNTVGDVCECYANLDGNGKVDVMDLLIMKNDYNRIDCNSDNATFSCQAGH